MSAPFSERISEYTSRIAGKLDEALPESTETPGRLHAAMRYSVLNGGKRVRPLLVYATGEYAGEPGTVIVAECPCGITSVIALSVNLRPAA